MTLMFDLGDEQLVVGAGSRKHRLATTAVAVLGIRLALRVT
jgi:hypothetical protein